MTTKEFHEEQVRQVLIGEDDKVLETLIKGASIVGEAVAGTLGPNGKNVLYISGNRPISTKDGVTVAKSITLKDPVENMGAYVIKEIAGRTADEAGDGTTTATVIATKILKSAARQIAAGARPAELKLQIEYAGAMALQYLAEEGLIKSMTDMQIPHIAMISSNGDKLISELVTEAFGNVGLDGHVGYAPSKTDHTFLDIVPGLKFNQGYTSPYFSNFIEEMEARHNDPFILVTDQDITSVQQVLPACEFAKKKNSPLVIIANSIVGEAENFVITNNVRNLLPSVVINAPGAAKEKKAFLEDIAVLTGAMLVLQSSGMQLSEIHPESMLGTCDQIIVSDSDTVIVNGGGDPEKLSKRISGIQASIDRDIKAPDVKHKEWRIAQLSGGMAMIYVAKDSEIQQREMIYRVEDAVEAVKSAGKEGYVSGGGSTYLRLSQMLRDRENILDPGISIMVEALMEPICRIAENGGYGREVVMHNVLEIDDPFHGWDARENQLGNMEEFGIIDPAKVVRQAIQNAVGVSSLIVNTHAVITFPS